MAFRLAKFASRACSTCASKGRWGKRGKYIVCTACGSEFIEMPDGELATVAKPEQKSPPNRVGSIRPTLRKERRDIARLEKKSRVHR